MTVEVTSDTHSMEQQDALRRTLHRCVKVAEGGVSVGQLRLRTRAWHVIGAHRTCFLLFWDRLQVHNCGIVQHLQRDDQAQIRQLTTAPAAPGTSHNSTHKHGVAANSARL